MPAIRDGSPRFSLWLSDVWPIVRKGLFVAAAAFVGAVAAPVFGVTVDHVPMLAIVSGAVGSTIDAVVKFLTDQSK